MGHFRPGFGMKKLTVPAALISSSLWRRSAVTRRIFTARVGAERRKFA